MKKYLLIILGLVIVVPLAGRAIWAYQQMKAQEIELTTSSSTTNVLAESTLASPASAISDDVIQKMSVINLKYDSSNCEREAMIKAFSPVAQKIIKCEVGKMSDLQKNFTYELFLLIEESDKKTSVVEKNSFIEESYRLLQEKYKDHAQDVSSLISLFDILDSRQYFFHRGHQRL